MFVVALVVSYHQITCCCLNPPRLPTHQIHAPAIDPDLGMQANRQGARDAKGAPEPLAVALEEVDCGGFGGGRIHCPTALSLWPGPLWLNDQRE